MGTLAFLHRHPIKALGHETLPDVTLTAGATMPGDRVWAVTHQATGPMATPGWQPCANFVRGVTAPELQAITAELGGEGGPVTLAHPRRPELTVVPDDPASVAELIDWLAPLVPEGRPRPTGLARVPGRGMTDTDFPSLSLGSLDTLNALSDRMGMRLSRLRFRMNLWIDGLTPLAELDWIGREVSLGPVRLRIEEPVGRCAATSANPATGERDSDTPQAIADWLGHRDFGVYARVIEGGTVSLGDALVLR